MKTTVCKTSLFRLSFRRTANLAVLLLAGGFASLGSAQSVPHSPVGTTWDCLVSGSHQRGIAVLTFSDDGSGFGGTFVGYKLSTTDPVTPSVPDVGRGGEDVGRSGTTGTTSGTSSNSQTLIFGYSPIDGTWTYDDRGRVIGFFNETLTEGNLTWPCAENVRVVSDTGLTNTISFCFTSSQFVTNVVFSDGTNKVFTFTTNQIPVGTTTTNSQNFVGSVSPGKHISLRSISPAGNITFSGIPIKTNLPDFSGHYFGYKTLSGQPSSLVTFDMVPNGLNFYSVSNGIGANFSFFGVSAVSSQKRIGFALMSTAAGSTENVLSAAVGSYTSNHHTTNAVTTGLESPGNKMKFNATFQHP